VAVVQYTFTHKQYTEQHKNLGRLLAVPHLCGCSMAFALQLRKKRGKPSVRVANTLKTKQDRRCAYNVTLRCVRVTTGLFKMIVVVLTTCHTQYTSDSSLCIFYLIEQHSQFLLRTLQVLYMCTLCDSTNTNTIIEFVPNCL
jgi:hypothetical protein